MINEIQNGGRRHLEFITIAMQWLATLLQNFINLSQTAAKLLGFVQKFEMAAAAILNLIFVQYYSPVSYTHLTLPTILRV